MYHTLFDSQATLFSWEIQMLYMSEDREFHCPFLWKNPCRFLNIEIVYTGIVVCIGLSKSCVFACDDPSTTRWILGTFRYIVLIGNARYSQTSFIRRLFEPPTCRSTVDYANHQPQTLKLFIGQDKGTWTGDKLYMQGAIKSNSYNKRS